MTAWRNGVVAPSFLDTRWSFTPRPLYRRGMSPPFTHWIGGLVDPESRSGHYEEDKNLISARNQTPAVHSVARRYTGLPITTPVHKSTDVINCAEFSVFVCSC
jgi:hypothetical protein